MLVLLQQVIALMQRVCCNAAQRKLSKELADSGGDSGNIMCVDCGGGTVDIIVHRKVEVADGKLGLREVAKGTGDCCGGTYLDSEFVQLLEDTIPVFDEYANNYPHEVMHSDACRTLMHDAL